MASSANQQRRVLVSPDDLIGHEIAGKYRLDSIIGGGGMGMVYRTTQKNLNRPVALKLLKLHEGASRKSLERFKREIDIVSQLTHPNIVRVYDSGIDPELRLHFITMELVEGVGLESLVARWKFAPALFIEIAREVCAALTEPHRLGIVHRDIKPGNILLTVRSDDTLGVKVVDFGISRSIEVEEDGRVTATGEVVGSPLYMAPEAARGGEIDGRTDLYSVGVLLYEMISGQPLFQGPTPVSVMLRHLGEPPPSLDEVLPSDTIPDDLSALVDSLLAKKPADRPGSARAVLRRLDEIREAHGLVELRLDGGMSPSEALDPWLIALESPNLAPNDTTEIRSPDSRTAGMPFFEGWLVPDSAELVACARTAPQPALDSDEPDPDGPGAHAQTEQWGLPAERTESDISTGRIARPSDDSEPDEVPAVHASRSGNHWAWIAAAAALVVLAAGAAVMWTSGENTETDARPDTVEMAAPDQETTGEPSEEASERARGADDEPEDNGSADIDPIDNPPVDDEPSSSEAVGSEPIRDKSETVPSIAQPSPPEISAEDNDSERDSAAKSTQKVADDTGPESGSEQEDDEDDEQLDQGLEWLRSR